MSGQQSEEVPARNVSEPCCGDGVEWSWGTHEEHQEFLRRYGREEF